MPLRLSAGLARRAQDLPLGILLIAGLFGILGLGSLAGGLYLVMEGGAITYWAASSIFILGPASLYFTYHLLNLARWSWMALLILIGLLFLSTLLRLQLAPGLPVPALGEILAEAAAAFYLTRPRVRARFAMSPSTAPARGAGSA